MAGSSGVCNGVCNGSCGHERCAPEKARGMGADQLLRNGEMNGGVSHGLLASGAESWQSRKDAGGTVPAFPEVAPVRTLDSEGPDTDLEMQAAVETILRALGEDTSREGLIKTPLRVVNAFKSAVQGQHSARESPEAILRSALFTEEGSRGGSGQGGGTGGTVLIRDIECFSTCAECLLPLRLHCHVAYVPQRDCVVGISKLPRAALAVARRLQSPQGFVAELCSAVDAAFMPAGVAVVAEAFHLVNLEHSVTAVPGVEQEAYSSAAKENGLMSGNGYMGVEAGSGAAGLHRCPHLTTSSGKPSDGGRGPRLGNDGSLGVLGWAKGGAAGSHLLAAATGCLGADESFEELLLMLGLARANVSLMLHRRGTPWELSPHRLEQDAGGETSCTQDHAVQPVQVRPLPTLFHRLLAAEGTEDPAGSYLAKRGEGQAGTLGAAEVLAAFCARQSSLEGPCSNSVDGISKARATSVEEPARRYLAYLMAATVGSGISPEKLLGFLEERGSGEGRGDSGNGLATTPLEGNGEVSGTRGFLEPFHKEVQFGNRTICYHQLPISSLCEHHLLPFFGHLRVWYCSSSAGAHGRIHGSMVEPAVLECVSLTFSRRLQVQERLTRQVAEAVDSLVSGSGAMALIEASHLCMSVRGVERPGASTSSISMLGCFSSEPRLRAFCLGLR